MLPFVLPFIRWADVAHLLASGYPARRRIYDHEFVMAVAGSGHIVLEGESHVAVPGRLFLVLPRQWHSYIPDAGGLSLLGVHFDWTPQHDTLRFPIFRAAYESQPADEALFRAPRGVPAWDLARQPFLELTARSRVRRMLEDVVAEYNRDDEGSRDGAGALLAAAVVQITREARGLQTQRAGAAVGPDALLRLERAQAALEDTENVQPIETVADSVGWSADHMRRMFRAALGTSPQRVQMTARLRRARDLLRDGNIPIHQVAEHCGFEDASHFARVFKAETGFTPREFQTLARKT